MTFKSENVQNHLKGKLITSHRNPKKIGFLGWVLGIPPNPKPNPKNPKNPIPKPTPNPNKMGILGVKI
jgi:hypothetical protein